MTNTDFFAAEAALNTVWTDEQEAIFEAIRSLDEGSTLAIRARAGTGKTTTAIEGLYHIGRPDCPNPNALFLAFNRRVGAELERKTPSNVTGATFHATALKLCRKELEIGKLWRVVRKQIHYSRYKLWHPAVQLAGLGKNMGIGLVLPNDLDIWLQMIEQYGVRHQKRFDPEEVASAGQALFQATLRDTKTLDFDDMLYSVAKNGVGRNFTPVDWLFVDEYQDTNPVQMKMIDQIREASGGTTRVVLIGDPRQAIYGWRGAGVKSFDLGVKRYQAEVLPLTTSWRCAREIISEAQLIVPDIQARPDAGAGQVERLQLHQFSIDDVSDGEVILCRNNAPIFELALHAIQANRSVYIAGKGLDKKIRKVFERIFGKPKKRLADTNDVTAFSREIIRVSDEYKGRPMAKSMLLDEVKAARAIWHIVKERTVGPHGVWSSHAGFFQDAENVLAEIFFDEAEGGKSEGIVFSTIHMSKGLEWDTVWFYRPELLPSKSAQTLGGWHLQQEDNLAYVAITRAKNRLVYVEGVEG